MGETTQFLHEQPIQEAKETFGTLLNFILYRYTKFLWVLLILLLKNKEMPEKWLVIISS